MELPIDGKEYTIYGDDYCGEWKGKALCKFYKKGSSKGQLKAGYRWILKDGSIEQAKHVKKYELLAP